MATAEGDLVRILDVDPELGYNLAPEDHEAARRYAVARTHTVETGDWAPLADSRDHSAHLGLLVVEGTVCRTIRLGHTACAELLGQGDVLRPWNEDCGFTVAHFDVSWTVLAPLRLATLDQRFAAVACRWPAMIDLIISRVVLRSRCLAFHLTVTHLTRVDVRLLVTMWFLAERWGRVSREGVVLPLRLTHQTLAHLIGAQRPSVTTALGELTSGGRITRCPDGSWLLHGEPPEELRRVEDTVARTPVS